MTSAELCRANGWVVGDVIQYERYRPYQITAIGDETVVLRMQYGRKKWPEKTWGYLDDRWRKVGHVEKGE